MLFGIRDVFKKMTENQLLKKLKIETKLTLLKKSKKLENLALRRAKEFLGKKFNMDDFLAEQFLDGKEVEKYWKIMRDYHKIAKRYPE